MKKIHFLSFLFLFSLAPFVFAEPVDGEVKPLPVPSKIRVLSALPKKEVWDKLTDQQKKLAYYLMKATKHGRSILFNQSHRHALSIKKFLENALSETNIEVCREKLGADGFHEFISYAAKFQDLNGPYEASNRKYVLTKSTSAQINELFSMFGPKMLDTDQIDIVRLLTDSAFEVMQRPQAANGEGLELTGGNLYQKGITAEDVRNAMASGTLVMDLNCRVARKADGTIFCEKQTVSTPGPVGKALRKIVKNLTRALPFTGTELQRTSLEKFISYFKTGNVEDFRQANIAWVRDRTNSPIDFMIGFVEVYEDYQAKIGSWESYVQIVDPETTQAALNLAKNAQYFEDRMPYGPYKKKFAPDYFPPAMMVYYLQEVSSMHTAGYNLPNFDDIRAMPDAGAKNVIRLDLPGENADEALLAARRELYTEFMPADKVEASLENAQKVWRILVLLHEIIGHGSGHYDESKYAKGEDPISALGSLGSALEEQRSDLNALVFAGDPKLVELGIYKDQGEALRMRNFMYDFYLGDFLRRLSRQRNFEEAHQRGHWLYVKSLMDSGAVGFASRDPGQAMTLQNQVLVVKDYEKVYQVSVELLAELQRIKATRDDAGLAQLFAEKAPLDVAQEPWAQAIIERGRDLTVNSGSVEQPWRVTSKGAFIPLGEPTLEGVVKARGNH